MAEVLLGLGSNLGDPQRNLGEALELLQPDCRIQRVSSCYRTEPVGYRDQNWFLNCAVKARTEASPQAVLEKATEIERTLGRRREILDGPRTIDVDILLIDDVVIERPGLTVPHPRMHLRRFVLTPAAEIAADWMHPVLLQTLGALLEQLDDPARVDRVSDSETLLRPLGDQPA